MATPINSLPSEVLACIFSEAACYCKRDLHHGPDPSALSPISLSVVCRYWRRVAVAHRPLWTHIDLVIDAMSSDGRYHSPEIWVERSKGAPLYLNISQPYPDRDEDYDEEEELLATAYPDPEQALAPMVHRLVDFLSPLMPQVCSLTAFLPSPNPSILTTLLNSWTKNGAPGCAKALTVHANPDLAESRIHSSESYKSFLESLEALHLGNTVLSWHSFDFKNLIKLEIEMGRGFWAMTPPEFAVVLASCPRLQYLSLHEFYIELPAAQAPKPVSLGELNVLRIGGFHYCSDGAAVFDSILGLIDPGQNLLSMKVSLPTLYCSTQRALDGIRSFIDRANVTTLWVIGSRDHRYFSSQLGPLPRVQTLVLEDWYFHDVLEFYRLRHLTPDDTRRPTNPELILWPELRNLYLHNCILEASYLRQLLSLHSIQNLYIQQCLGEDSKQPAVAPSAEPYISGEYVPLSKFVSNVVYVPGILRDLPLSLFQAGVYFQF